ncbi:Gfo/Idh/MocA family oxidoreductase, partial [bacterium]|nr:Gfo/Idh/MocA family oxidoreductase [bacterium]
MIKLGIIGTGGMANAQAQNFSKIKNVKIVAACDIVDDKVKDFAKQYNIQKTFTDIDDMLENAGIDAVSNVTPDAFHAAVSLKIIESGKHILCEKPLATNYPDAKKMADAAKAKGVINMVNFS